MEGERERKVESEKRDYGRGTRTHEHRGENHRRTTFHFNNNYFFVYNVLFYRIGKIEKLG